MRVGIDSASIQEPHFDEAGATQVAVAGADRAAVVDRPLYATSGRAAAGFTVIAGVRDDLVQVVVTGVARNASNEAAAIEAAGAAVDLLRP